MADLDQIKKLGETLEPVYQAECVACGNTEIAPSNFITERAAATHFHNFGWRVIENEAQCPECIATEET